MSKFRLVTIVLVLLGMLIPASAGMAATDLSQFEVINHSDQPITMWMYESTSYQDPAMDGVQYEKVKNGAFYFLNIDAGERVTFTVKRALYSYTMNLCGGDSRAGAIDLSNYNRIVVPKCGIFALELPGKKSGQELDNVTELIELVKFTATNISDTTAFLTISGQGATYHFTLVPGAAKEITVEEGQYTYSYWACSKPAAAQSFTPFFHTNLKLTCP
ncbi:MAG: hypothetical protein HN413_14345 [Chloroflexi bacterium]|jgi:hypothetical protein|nr:hypothetical protein [Chloroflexota bacterium]